jgi:hypothetical protein
METSASFEARSAPSPYPTAYEPGNINACVLMIAEKAADLVLGHRPLPPAVV